MTRPLALAWILCAGLAAWPGRLAADSTPVRLTVPFFPDRTDQCGPSALASVLTYWHQEATPQTLRDEIYVKKLGGSLPFDLLIAARKRLPARMVNEGLEGLKDELRQGRPVIAHLNRGTRWMPAGHYVVVVGFDDGRGGVYAHSAGDEAAFLPYARFLKQWEKTDHWALYVSSPSAASPRP